jgi:type I restriction enzyme S subunit
LFSKTGDKPVVSYFSEQTAIAKVLSDMDTEIDVLKEKLAKNQQIKQGMMHNLLTGKIRLV